MVFWGMENRQSVLDQFGQIDIYLFDQLLRGRIAPGMKIFDAGCGTGRNVEYLLKAGYEVFGADSSPAAIAEVRRKAAELAPALRADNFRVEPLDALTFPKPFADVVTCNAVLHFAQDDVQFLRMLKGCWEALTPGGLFFCRLASSIGLDGRGRSLGGRRFRLPDGSERYLVDEGMLMTLTSQLPGKLIDPLKTTVVQGQRCMTTWVVRSLIEPAEFSSSDVSRHAVQDTIQILPYQPAWASQFEAERARLAAALGDVAVRIEHHGSTSVPRLPAKPVIDIQISVRSLQPMSSYIALLEQLGYVHRPHADDARCPFFFYPRQWPSTHHVHVVESGGEEESVTLAFRDYLRDHDEVAAEYGRLKISLAPQFSATAANERENYADAKGAFVRRITQRAIDEGYPKRVD